MSLPVRRMSFTSAVLCGATTGGFGFEAGERKDVGIGMELEGWKNSKVSADGA